MLEYNQNIKEIISKRKSCRAFDRKEIDGTTKAEIQKNCNSLTRGIAKEKAQFNIVNTSDFDGKIFQKEFVKNSVNFLVGEVENGPYANYSYGYLAQQLVLKITELNLGSCWIGYFDKAYFIEEKSFSKGIFPVLIIIGYKSSTGLMHNSITRLAVGSFSRKAFERLFYQNNFDYSLKANEAGIFRDALEMVRLAPSAGNLQPWRIIVDNNAGECHFYLKKMSERYYQSKLHQVDMGIAMCHFELTLKSSNVFGDWNVKNPKLNESADCEYVISWKNKLSN